MFFSAAHIVAVHTEMRAGKSPAMLICQDFRRVYFPDGVPQNPVKAVEKLHMRPFPIRPGPQPYQAF